MEQTRLLLLDLDGTLAAKWQPELLPGRLEVLARLNVPVTVVTNQGGIHARYHWEAMGRPGRAEKYPTVTGILERLESITRQIPQIKRAYVAFFVGHDDYALPEDRSDVVETLSTGVTVHGAWDPAWRKPSGGMLRQACCDFRVAPHQALMIGDKEYDREAARNAGNVRYVHVTAATWTEGFLA